MTASLNFQEPNVLQTSHGGHYGTQFHWVRASFIGSSANSHSLNPLRNETQRGFLSGKGKIVVYGLGTIEMLEMIIFLLSITRNVSIGSRGRVIHHQTHQ